MHLMVVCMCVYQRVCLFSFYLVKFRLYHWIRVDMLLNAVICSMCVCLSLRGCVFVLVLEYRLEITCGFPIPIRIPIVCWPSHRRHFIQNTHTLTHTAWHNMLQCRCFLRDSCLLINITQKNTDRHVQHLLCPPKWMCVCACACVLNESSSLRLPHRNLFSLILFAFHLLGFCVCVFYFCYSLFV